MEWSGLSSFQEVPSQILRRKDDDIFDRLNHRWTPLVLFSFVFLLSCASWVGKPIDCWVPAHFAPSWEDFTNSYCWIRNTYWLDFNQNIPKDPAEREIHPIIYYQWVPLILLIQAVLFWIPGLIWRSWNTHSGIDLDDVIQAAEMLRYTGDLKTKEYFLDILVKKTDCYLERNNHPANKKWLKNCYLSVTYLICKCIMLANVVGQLFLLNRFLGYDFHLYGFDAVSAMIKGEDWSESPRFPRVTLCDVDLRRLGNVHRYTVQCVLAINLFNEMIFLFIWLWLVLVSLLTAYGIVLRLWRMTFPYDRYMYIKKHLVLYSEENEEVTENDGTSDANDDKNGQANKMRSFESSTPKSDNTSQQTNAEQTNEVKVPERPIKGYDPVHLKTFVFEYLCQDGVLMFRLVGHNTNKTVVNEFVCKMFAFYKSKQYKDMTPLYRPIPEKNKV